uniref:NFKB inhibitor interacting Ras-like 1 n=1 Tax=Sinocyclocheilus anshuiensis TaxID=1608454 RepID=A0A671SUH5_9TELE
MGKGCKVVVCGMASVGKTAVLEQLLYGSHTVGMCDQHIRGVCGDVREQLRLYDTRGLREGLDLPKHFFSAAAGFVLDYSVDSLESFRRVELLKKEIDKSRDKKEVMVMVLGNKCDLRERRQVDQDVAQQWARGEKLTLWVTDRKKLFDRTLQQPHQPQSKSAIPLPGRKSKGTLSSDI